MRVKLYLFDTSKRRLEENLKAVGFDLERLVAEFGPQDYQLPPGPSNNPWQARDPYGERLSQPGQPGLGYGIPLEAENEKVAREFLGRFRERAFGSDRPDIARILGIDLTPLSMTSAKPNQHWCAGDGMGRHFAGRAQANRLIELESLQACKLTGAGVNVFVVDQGINRHYLETLGGTYGGGMYWTADGKSQVPGEMQPPHAPAPKGHGAMLLRSLVDIAPDATYFDLPLLPQRITEVENFSLRALFAFAFLNYFFLSCNGPWVILNAWGIVDRFSEKLRGFYTDDPNHALNSYLSELGCHHDVIFAAGNSGQFCGDPRSSGYDCGPGRSIWGANGLPDVTCVGAVRGDGIWVGAASQGPGPGGFDTGAGRPEKPDVCAPSWFVENANAHLRSAGTSGASAVVAGAVAALRQGWSMNAVSPAEMRKALRDGSHGSAGKGWNARYGDGILNLAGTIAQLP
ncbi:S8 family serine peptidase [uncultured Roseobacter sp.]|uniref:S8 family serine peptidase n=1 Tax=uncultured Roseobacter sp. TaxID=114847 RepID=UPI002607D896|nr:S8 family serine peptidase [uncultured Roseobacter sp.]